MKIFIKKTYHGLRNKKKRGQFLVLSSFLITFLIARLTVYFQTQGIIPTQNGYPHIHHLVFGIFITLISSDIGISYWYHEHLRLWMTTFFGIGTALTMEEFALWFFLKDAYWSREGRYSIDAVIVTAVIFLIVYLVSEAHDHYWVKRKK